MIFICILGVNRTVKCGNGTDCSTACSEGNNQNFTEKNGCLTFITDDEASNNTDFCNTDCGSDKFFPRPLTCRNHCGSTVPLQLINLTCYCDQNCHFLNNCCSDYNSFCSTTTLTPQLTSATGTTTGTTAGKTVGTTTGTTGWSSFQSQFYKLFIPKMSWAEAQASCEQEGAIFVSIPNQGVNNFVATLGSDLPAVLIGGYQQEPYVTKTWAWFDGSFDWSYENWDNGQPNYNGNERCVMMYPSSGKWHDVSCNSYKFPYVCSKLGKSYFSFQFVILF